MFAVNLMPWRKGREGENTSPITRFRSEMDSLFERFFGEPLSRGSWFEREGNGWAMPWNPSLDVSETDTEIVVRAEVPGVDPKDFDVTISGDVLTLSGEKKESSEERSGDFYRAERRFGSFRRTLPLPTAVDQEKIAAEYENGVLTIRLPKTESAQAKRIPVSAGR